MTTDARERVDIAVLRQYQASLKARGAQRGIEVRCWADGSYSVTRHGLTKTLKTLPDLEAWLTRAGA